MPTPIVRINARIHTHSHPRGMQDAHPEQHGSPEQEVEKSGRLCAGVAHTEQHPSSRSVASVSVSVRCPRGRRKLQCGGDRHGVQTPVGPGAKGSATNGTLGMSRMPLRQTSCVHGYVARTLQVSLPMQRHRGNQSLFVMTNNTHPCLHHRSPVFFANGSECRITDGSKKRKC